jgi:HAD superfamily hydrolase (TIGR01509 family)
VLPTLRRLKARGLRLAAVSNWDERLRPLLRDLRVAAFFDPIVISIEVGAAKPAPPVFRRCADALGLAASAVLHVGDSPTEDYEGALRAGMRALLVRRRCTGVNESGSCRSLDALLSLAAGSETN